MDDLALDPTMAGFSPDAPPDEEMLAAAGLDAFMPAYPAWLFKVNKKTGRRELKPPKRPDSGTFSQWAGSDHADYSMLLLRFLSDLRFYRQKDAGVLSTFKEGDVGFFSIEPTTQINKLCTMVSGIPPRVSWSFKTEPEKAAAQAMEDWAYHFLEQWQVIHRSQYNSSLYWDIMFSLGIYGRFIARILPDDADPDFPWKPELCDPATCFPVFGDKFGLLRMTRVYTETIGKVIDGLDPDGGRGIYRKLNNASRKRDQDASLDYTRQTTVREVWTRWSAYVEVDGVEVLRWDHEYGRVPFVQILAPGEMGMTSTPELTGIAVNPDDVRDRESWGWSGVTNRQMDIARKGLSFFHAFRGSIRFEEMLYGVMATIVQLDANPPQITESGYDSDPSPVDMRPGGHTKRRPGEKTTPVQTQARAQVLGPLLNELRSQRQKAGLPDNVFGIVDGSNVTGFAENTLLAATKDRIQPYLDGVAQGIGDCIELAAYLYHGFGHLYVDDPNGEYTVPRRSKNPYASPVKGPMPPVFQMQAQGMGLPDIASQVQGMGMPPPPGMPGGAGQGPPHLDDPEVAVSREVMDQVGFRPKVVLESWDWNKMTQIANVAQMLVQGGIWSQFTARDKLGVEDPTQEGRWIDVEAAKKHPMMMPIMIAQALWETGNVNAFTAFTSALMGQQQPGGAPGLPGAGQGGEAQNPVDPTNGGSVRGVQSVQGDSQPSISPDRGPGNPGGSPQGNDVGP